MKRINHPLHLFLLLFISTLISACDGGASKNMVLKLGHGLPPAHPVHMGLERMNEELQKLSGGTMEIDIYPSSQLGSEIQCIELLQIGSLDITKVSSASLESFVDPFKIFGIPYIFRSRAHYDNVLNSEVGEEFLTSTEPYWFRGITYFDAGARSFYTTERAIRKPEDLKGLKIRVQKSPLAVEMVNVFGGSATPVDWGELYTALQSNVVDGAENNTPSITTAFHHEVSKYYSVNEHTYSPDVIIVGSKTWAKLSDEQRGWLKEAAERGRVYQRELWAKQEQLSLDQMIESGVEVIYPDKQLFIDAAQPMVQKYRENPKFTELINKIEAVSDEE